MLNEDLSLDFFNMKSSDMFVMLGYGLMKSPPTSSLLLLIPSFRSLFLDPQILRNRERKERKQKKERRRAQGSWIQCKESKRGKG